MAIFGLSLGGRINAVWRAVAGAVNPTRLLATALLAALLALRVWDPAPVEILRLLVFDQYQRWLPRPKAPQAIVIVDIDEASLAAVGQFPWPRTVIADLVEKLFEAGAVVVGFDIMFSEPDRMSPAQFADTAVGLTPQMAEALRKLPSNDRVLADVLRRTRVVLGQAATHQVIDRDGAVKPPKSTPVTRLGRDPRPYLDTWPAAIHNLPELVEAAAGQGMFSVKPEMDNIVRRVQAIIKVEDKLYPSLSLELLRVATGQSALGIKTNEAGIESVYVAGAWIPTDRHGQIWVRYARHDPSRYVSAKDVLAGRLASGAVAGKMVLVGTSAAGLHDLRATPLGEVIPGVEVHLQLIDTILTQSHLIRPNYTVTAELLVILVAGLLLVILVPTHGAYWTMGLNVAVAGALAGASWYLFSRQGVLLDAAYPTVATFSVYGLLSFTNYAREEAQRRQIREAFGHYLSPEMVDQLARDPGMLKLGGENREMTLLFCDVQGFTSISEKYDAESLTRLINRLLTPLTDAILKAHGTIDKYMGDCIMAFWNAPMENQDHARDACGAALAMIGRLVVLNAELKREADEQGQEFMPLKVGIGLNTGVCCVGNMGSEQRFDYSVIGDQVNLTSRLEGQTRTYRVPILIGEATRELVADMATLELDVIQVKGKAVPTRIFALLGDEKLAATPEFAALRQAHEKMLAAYRAQDWRAARDALKADHAHANGLEISDLLNMYEERIVAYEADPPDKDWDGVYHATTK